MSPRRSPDESPDASAEQVASPLSLAPPPPSRGRFAPRTTAMWAIGAVTALLGLLVVRRRRRTR
ncbi:hypothetical protein ACRYCC_13035 [Actinomadura scrupuli]|uniref:hypothetical protein n=1 Tax=Actinomadura scrupuli TaxID=559629 RepID=UPI003D961D11